MTHDDAQQWFNYVQAELIAKEDERNPRLLYAALQYWLARHPEHRALARYLAKPADERLAEDRVHQIPRAFMDWVQRHTPDQLAELIHFIG